MTDKQLIWSINRREQKHAEWMDAIHDAESVGNWKVADKLQKKLANSEAIMTRVLQNTTKDQYDRTVACRLCAEWEDWQE